MSRPRSVRTTRPSRLLAGLVIGAGVAGCATTPDPVAPALTSIESDALLDVVRRHNTRVDRLQRLHRRGVVEMEWTDDEGKRHQEWQVNLYLWVRMPGETALRGEKAGREFWLGSGADGHWFFDAINDDHVLHVGDGSSVRLFGVNAFTLLDLLGLVHLPDEDLAFAELASTASVAEDGTWWLTAHGAGGPCRLRFDPVRALPVEIVVAGTGGPDAAPVHARLDRYETMELRGLPPLAQPKFPLKVRLEDEAERFLIDLAFSGESRPLDAQPWDNVFDLDYLMRRFEPKTIHTADAGP